MFTKCISRSLILVPLFLTLAGCLEVSSSSAGQATIPDLTIECPQAAFPSTYCRGGADTLWIGLTSDFNLDCPTVMSSFPAATRNSYFSAIATGSGFSHVGGLSTLSISSWKSSLGGSISTLTSGTYKACAFIEISGGNNQLDLNEPLGAAVITVDGTSPQVVDDWIAY